MNHYIYVNFGCVTQKTRQKQYFFVSPQQFYPLLQHTLLNPLTTTKKVSYATHKFIIQTQKINDPF